MPKYLIQASYTAEGVRGLMKDGGSQRRAAAEAALKGGGGRLGAVYFAFGETDVFAVADVPAKASAAAVSLGVSASGAGPGKNGVVLTPHGIEQAGHKMIN